GKNRRGRRRLRRKARSTHSPIERLSLSRPPVARQILRGKRSLGQLGERKRKADSGRHGAPRRTAPPRKLARSFGGLAWGRRRRNHFGACPPSFISKTIRRT